MKIITLAELLRCPKGTIFRQIVPYTWKGDWCKFDSPCGDDDFFYSDVGPAIEIPGYDSRQPQGAVAISDVCGRDGFFDADRVFAVLERDDITEWIDQLRRELPGKFICHEFNEEF